MTSLWSARALRGLGVVIVATLALLSTACEHPPLEEHPTDNPAFHVSLLFEYDGCRVYRFEDGSLRYFVHCRGGGSQAAMWDQSNGKTTTPMMIPTGTP